MSDDELQDENPHRRHSPSIEQDAHCQHCQGAKERSPDEMGKTKTNTWTQTPGRSTGSVQQERENNRQEHRSPARSTARSTARFQRVRSPPRRQHRRSRSRSPIIRKKVLLPIIIQTCSLFLLHSNLSAT